MNGMNPGTWPDQPQEKLYTASDLKATRLETQGRGSSTSK
jgi:hypothetical protein